MSNRPSVSSFVCAALLVSATVAVAGQTPATGRAAVRRVAGLHRGIFVPIPAELQRGALHQGTLRLATGAETVLEETFFFTVAPDSSNPVLQFGASRPELAGEIDRMSPEAAAKTCLDVVVDGAPVASYPAKELLGLGATRGDQKIEPQPLRFVRRGATPVSEERSTETPETRRSCSAQEIQACNDNFAACVDACHIRPRRLPGDEEQCENDCYASYLACSTDRVVDEWTDVYYYNTQPTFWIACLRPFWYNPFAAHNYMNWTYTRVEVHRQRIYHGCNGTEDVVTLSQTSNWAECWRETGDDSGCEASNSSCCAENRCPF